MLIGELPRQPGREVPLISAALIVAAGAGGCFGVVFAVVAPLVSADFQPLRASVQDIALFAVGVSLTAITLLLDQALIGLLRGELQLWRNALFATAKLAALFLASLWLSHAVGLTIYTTWVIGNVISLTVLARFLILKGGWSVRSYLPRWGVLQKLGWAALEHHVLNLMLQAPTLALPVLVTVILSARMNAWFYVSWTISGFVSIVPFALTTVLYATNSAEPTTLAHKARLTLSLSFVTCILAVCLLQLCSKQVLDSFGHVYAEQALWSLRILSLGAFPLIIKNHYVAVCRIQGRIARAILPLAAGALLELVIAVLGARLGGLAGLSQGWIIAVIIESVYMFTTVYKAVRFIDTSTQVDTLTQRAIRQNYIEGQH